MRLKTRFQNEDFELGEVVDAAVCHGGAHAIKVVANASQDRIYNFYYDSLASMYKEWEDAPEEPKENWFIDIRYPKVEPKKDICLSNSMRKRLKEIGNYFGTKKEAEKAVKDLKALKRLRDKGFRFTGYSQEDREYIHQIEIYAETDGVIDGKAFDLAEDPDIKWLFGGEKNEI